MKFLVIFSISNYYGSPFVVETTSGKYFFGLPDYSEIKTIEVSKEFYLSFFKEFGRKGKSMDYDTFRKKFSSMTIPSIEGEEDE